MGDKKVFLNIFSARGHLTSVAETPLFELRLHTLNKKLIIIESLFLSFLYFSFLKNLNPELMVRNVKKFNK